MSVEVPKPVEETPVTKPAETTEQPDTTVPTTETAAATTEEPATEVIKTADDKVVVEAKPASEGTLGYKAPGFLKQFVFSKHFFWFNEETSTAESLATYVSQEKPENAHHQAAWAQETGKGVLFYTKRAEDKSHPSGLILLADASNVVKEGALEFSFIINKKSHRFEAPTTTERDSWVVAVEKAIQESKDIKEEVTGRESYKKTLTGLASPVVTAAKAERSNSKAPKKSLEANTATAAAAEEPAAKEEAAEAETEDKAAKKERSQSRKRASVFGMFGKKDEDKEAKKEAEKAEKEVKKAEAEQVKLDKKNEAEAKKEEAKETHETAPAVEAVEAAAVAAAPATVVAAVENKKEKDHAKEAEAEASSPTDKKSKRNSVFGLFSKKVTSPSTEKSEKEAAAPAETAEVPPVSETAPKLDEPIENKPIDTAAVTAPVDTVETPAATTEAAAEEPAKEAPVTATESSPKAEKKTGGFLGFIKSQVRESKTTQKEIAKEESEEKKAAEPASITAAVPTPTEPATTTEPATETPAAEGTKDERATREKRRSSFFSLGTIKKKSTTPAEGAEAEGTTSEVKREKSPLPGKLGGMFRKSSKTVKPAETEAAAAETDAPKTDAAVVEAPAADATAAETTETKVVGDVATETTAPVHDAVTTAPTEVKASA